MIVHGYNLTMYFSSKKDLVKDYVTTPGPIPLKISFLMDCIILHDLVTPKECFISVSLLRRPSKVSKTLH